jgi:alpha-glucosidase
LTSPERLAHYLRPDELHTAFNFDFLKSPWDAGAMRDAIDTTRAALGAVGAPCTWVLSNHDEPRHVTRFGLSETGWRNTLLPDLGEPDLVLGTRRARAAALLLLALPGSAYVYQGEELGLWYIRDIPDELLQDPSWERSGHVIRGRDGSRVPIPWDGSEPPFGFGPAGSTPWLPQPPSWAASSVAAESGDPDSMLSLYRAAFAVRRTDPGLAGDGFAWRESPQGSLVFERGGLVCAVNLAADPLALPAGRRTILRSDGAAGDALPADTAEWFRIDDIASATAAGTPEAGEAPAAAEAAEDGR